MGHSHRNLASYFQIDLSKKDSLLWKKKKKNVCSLEALLVELLNSQLSLERRLHA